jgi:hypothetical protein
MFIDVFGTAKSVIKCMDKDSLDLYFKFVIIGRTKGVQEDGHKIVIPCIKEEVQGSHLRPEVWRLKHLIGVKKELGQTWQTIFNEFEIS